MKKFITNSKYSKIFSIVGDFSFKIGSSIIETIANQILLFPMLASIFSSEIYGMILTVMGVINTVTSGLGNSLNNTRLIMKTEYADEKIIGDFNIIILVSSLMSTITIIIMYFAIPDLGIVSTLLLIPTIIMLTANAYYMVWYILKLDFKGSLIYSIIISCGIIIGAFLVKLTNIWPLASLLSSIFGFIYLKTQTPLIKEHFHRTRLFPKALFKYILLLMTAVIANSMVYMDRLILYPIIGGGAVAIYTTAAFFGKALNIIMTPISSVMLGYYAQGSFSMTRKRFWFINATSLGIFTIFIGFSYLFAPLITGLLFPTLIGEALPYIVIANVANAIGAVVSMTQSVALKYAAIYWQIIIQIVYVATYICGGIILLNMYGLIGFCYVVLFANIVRLLMLYTVCHFSLKRHREVDTIIVNNKGN